MLRPLFSAIMATVVLVLPAMAQDFSGRYFGFGLGYLDGSPNHNQAGNPFDGHDVNVSGATFNLIYGKNWQNENKVYGYDATLRFSNANGSTTIPFLNPPISPSASPCLEPGCSHEVNALGTFNGRFGFVTRGGFLPYVTAGLALGDVFASATGPCARPCQIDEIRFGFNVGIGVEWQTKSGWRMRGELSYIDLGDDISMDGSFPEFPVRADFQYSTLSFGMVRRF